MSNEDYHAKQRRLRAEFDAREEQRRGEELLRHQAHALERKLGSSPRARALAASSQPERTVRGPDRMVTVPAKTFHVLPGGIVGTGDHKVDTNGACWCQPRREAGLAADETYWRHHAVAPWEGE